MSSESIMKTGGTVRIRPAAVSDATAIQQVLKRNGMGNQEQGVWVSRWKTYPFAAEFSGLAPGWVLETEDGSVVGNLDNVHMLYEFGGRRLKGAIAAEWAVDAAYRGKAVQLMGTFFKQQGIDLWLNVSANPTAAQVMTAMRIARIPIPDHGIPCFWATRPRAFAEAALLRKSIRGASLLSLPAGVALFVRDLCLGSGRGSTRLPVRSLGQFDDRFNEFFQHSLTTVKRLRAVRNKAVLEWRFQADLSAGRADVVAVEQGRNLLGYAVLVRREDPVLRMTLYDIADLQAAEDNPKIMRDLLLGSIQIAREKGADAVKFMSGTPIKRAAANALKPYTYHMPFWQQYFKVIPELSAELSTADAWEFSLFDTF